MQHKIALIENTERADSLGPLGGTLIELAVKIGNRVYMKRVQINKQEEKLAIYNEKRHRIGELFIDVGKEIQADEGQTDEGR